MSLYYFDASALVKLYVAEAHGERVRQTAARADQIACSLIAYIETRAAFARRHRVKELSVAEFERAKRDFDRDWQVFSALSIDTELARQAADFAERFALRSYDAIHLASADRLRRETGNEMSFACFDKALNGAAESIGMRLFLGSMP